MGKNRILHMILSSVLMLLLLGTMIPAFGQEAAPAHENAGGSRLVIQEAGTYILTGEMSGGVCVDVESGEVVLVLDGVDIDCAEGPAIEALHGDLLQIVLRKCTVNRIADQETNAAKAVFRSNIDTVLTGCGRLLVEAKSGDGMVMEDADLTVTGGQTLILAPSFGFRTEGSEPGELFFRGGSVYVNAAEGIAPEETVIHQEGGILDVTEKHTLEEVFGPMPCCTPCCLPYECPEEDDECDKYPEPTVDEPQEIVEGIVTNEAVELEPDYEHAIRIVMSKDNNRVEITEPGTYIVSGSASDGRVSVKKDTDKVILVLENLELTRETGAVIEVGKNAAAKICIEGEVSLKNTASSEDAQALDDQGVVQGDEGSSICLTGPGSLDIAAGTGSGIGMGEDSSLVINGDIEINIEADLDGIHSDADVAILDGDLTISAGDDGIDADHILTIGDDENGGPDITVEKSEEGLKAAVINIKDGDISLVAEGDGIEAELQDGVCDDLSKASVNITGGDVVIYAGDEGIDSNGNVNLVEGSAQINVPADCDNKFITQEEELYISDDFELELRISEEEPGNG